MYADYYVPKLLSMQVNSRSKARPRRYNPSLESELFFNIISDSI